MGLVAIVFLTGLLSQNILDIKPYQVVLRIPRVLKALLLPSQSVTQANIEHLLFTRHYIPRVYSLLSKNCPNLQVRKPRFKEANHGSSKTQQVSGTVSTRPRSDFRSWAF